MNKRHHRFHFIFFLLLSLFFCFSTVRADVTITTAETATVDLETRNPVASPRNATVSPTGAVDVTANPANPAAIWASVDGWNVTVSSGREIKGNAFGVLFNDTSDGGGNSQSGILTNGGVVSATSATGDAYGIYMGGDTSVINNSGSISGNTSANSYEAIGVNMEGAANTLTNSGNITGTSTGNGSYTSGVYMDGDTNTLTNSGIISGNSSGSSCDTYGVDAEAYTNNVTNSGNIKGNTTGNDSEATGVYMDGDTNTLTNSGTISAKTTGINAAAFGVYTEDYTTTKNTIANSGIISANTSGNYSGALGVYMGDGDGDITNSGTISASTSGDYSHAKGVDMGSGVNTITNTGTISGTASGYNANAAGVYMENYSGANTITSSGRILGNTSGYDSNAFGVYMYSDNDTNTITNSGTISGNSTGNGSYAYGVYMIGIDANDITNFETISGNSSGYDSDTYGAYTYSYSDMNTLTNYGTISGNSTGNGSYAYGVYMDGLFNSLTNFSAISANTSGNDAEATGAYMNASINNVINAGSISGNSSGNGSDAYGLKMVGAGNALVNCGSITGNATGASSEAYGVYMSGLTNSIDNSGRISGATGIFVDAGNTTIDNSGIITGTGGTAIQLADAANTVVLRTGSVITGVIKGGSTGTDSMKLNGAGVLNADQIVNFENLSKKGTGMWSVTAGTSPLTIATAVSIEAGTLAFGGNVTTPTYSQNTAANLGLIVNPTTSATVTAGAATLNSGGVLVVPEAGFYARNTNYGVVFTATGTMIGAFGGVSSTSPFLTPVLTAGANNYSLSLKRDYNLPASTENQSAMAAMLNAYADTMVGKASDSGLAYLMLVSSRAEAQSALDQLSGLSHTALMSASFSSFNQYLGSITGRMGGFATGGPSFAYRGGTLLASRDDMASDAGNTLLALGTMRGDNDPTAWGFWARGYGNLGEMRGGDVSSTYDYNTGGVTTGFDRKINNNLLLGLSAGYSYTKVDMKDLSDSGNVSSYQGSLYGAYLNGPWYVNGILAYGYNVYHTSRNITFGGMGRVAHADYSGDALGAYGEAGYRIEVKTVNIIPMASLQASYLTRNGFTESDAGDLNLDADREHTASWLSALGIKVRKDFSVNTVTITPEVRVKWLHEFSDDDYMVNASFAEAPATTFTVRGDKPNRDSIALGLGLTCLAKENLNIFLTYDANIASDRTEQGASLGLRYRW